MLRRKREGGEREGGKRERVIEGLDEDWFSSYVHVIESVTVIRVVPAIVD